MDKKELEKEMKDRKAKLFEKENRIYKYYLNSVEDAPEAIDFIKSLFKLELIEADKSEYQDLVALYDIVGFDKFFEILAYFNARQLRFPKLEKIKKMLIVAIAYYQTEVLRLSPKEAGKLLSDKLGIFNLKQKSIKSIVGKLQQTIDHLAENAARKVASDAAERGDFSLAGFFAEEDEFELEDRKVFTEDELDNVESEESDDE